MPDLGHVLFSGTIPIALADAKTRKPSAKRILECSDRGAATKKAVLDPAWSLAFPAATAREGGMWTAKRT